MWLQPYLNPSPNLLYFPFPKRKWCLVTCQFHHICYYYILGQKYRRVNSKSKNNNFELYKCEYSSATPSVILPFSLDDYLLWSWSWNQCAENPNSSENTFKSWECIVCFHGCSGLGWPLGHYDPRYSFSADYLNHNGQRRGHCIEVSGMLIFHLHSWITSQSKTASHFYTSLPRCLYAEYSPFNIGYSM